MLEAGIGLFIFLVVFLVWLGFLLSLNKLVSVMRVDGLQQTFISKVWVWTQIIPFWGFVALIVFNIKADTAARALEVEFKLPFKEIKYPATIGWIVIFGVLYSWIPILGALLFLIFMILFWVKVSSTSKQIELLKTNTKISIES